MKYVKGNKDGWSDKAVSDIIGGSADFTVLQIPKCRNINNREDNKKPPPVKSRERDKENCDDDRSKEVFGTNKTFHQKRLFHAYDYTTK